MEGRSLECIYDKATTTRRLCVRGAGGRPQLIMKKALGEMHCKLCEAGCSKAEPKIFASPQTPFPGAQDGQNLISWRWSLPSSTDPVW